MVKRWPRYLDWKVKGQLVSFAFAHLTIPFSFFFSFFHTVPVRSPLSPSVFPFLSITSLFLSPPPPFLATLPSPFFSPSFLLYLFTLPLFSSLFPVLILPYYSSFLIPSSPSCLLLPPPPTYSFAYKFPLTINFFVPLTRVHLMSWLSYL